MRKWWFMIMMGWVTNVFAAPLTLNVEEANLSDVLQFVAQSIPANIVVSPRVQGVVSVHWNKVDPLSGFNLLLRMNGLMRAPYGAMWYIAAADEFLQTADQQAKWQTAETAALPLQTRLFQIHYASAKTLAAMLGENKNSLLSSRGTWEVDDRTNILMVTDIAPRLAVIHNMIQQLDVPVKQILIEARLAAIDEAGESALGLDFSTISAGKVKTDEGYYSLAVAHLADGSQLDMKLAALQKDGKAELISSPTLFTVNQQAASIESGQEVPYQEESESGGTTVVFKKAVLGLQVVPQLLPAGHVLLKLKITQDRPDVVEVQGMPVISTRAITTQVLAQNGQTVVLGGIYEDDHETSVKRLPYLSRLPWIGRLFEMKADNRDKRKLLIFVTPKLIAQAT